MYDLVIIGAGPTGLMAAKTAAEKGLRVVVVEKKEDISDVRRACCAQLIMDDGYENEALNVKDGKIIFRENKFEVPYKGKIIELQNKYCISPKGHKIHFANGNGTPFAVKFDKGVLLQGIFEEAKKAGAEFMLKTVAYSAEDSPAGVNIEIVADGVKSSVKGKKCIVAEGVNALVTEALGFNKQRKFITTAFVMKYIVKGTSGFDRQSWHLFYGKAYSSNAAVIIGPSLYGDDVIELTAMGNKTITPEMIYNGVSTKGPIAENFKNAKVIDRHACSVRAFTPLKKPFKNNVIITGDSAAYVEVEVQGGLMCGYKAANAVAKELKGEKGFEEYEKWWLDSFEFNSDDFLKVAQGYALVPTYTDDELDYLFALTEDQVLEGTYSQYKTPALIWASILRHKDKIAGEKPDLYKKIEKIDEMSLDSTF